MNRRASILAFGILAGLLTTSVTQAGIVPLSRTSTLHIAGVAGPDEFNTFRSTDGLTETTDTLSGVALDPNNGTTARTTASHHSSVEFFSTGDRFKASARGAGNVFAMFSPTDNSGPLIADATSEYSVSFRITGKSANLDVSGTFGGAISSASVLLAETSDAAHPRSIYSVMDDTPFNFQFGATEVLQPGTYTFSARAFAGSSGGAGTDTRSSNFDTSISVDQRVHAVPLPPAAWSGLCSMLSLGAFLRRKALIKKFEPGLN